MSSRPAPDDPRPLLAIFALLVGYAIWRLLSRLEPARLLDLLIPRASALPIALAATTIATALATHRLLATRRTLASRRALLIVPADGFDPSPDAVLSFAAQLARVERKGGGWFDRRAAALRIHLTNDAEGHLAYILEAPERDLSLLRSALRSYRGIDLRDGAELLSGATGVKTKAVRSELVLAHPSVEPLARLAPDPDLLGPFAAAVADLRSKRGERVDVCVDLLPAGSRRAQRLRRGLRRQATRGQSGSGPGLAEVLGGERASRGRTDPAELAERRRQGRGLDAKLREGIALYEAQILLCARAPERGRAKVAMRSLLAAFEPLSDRNRLRVAGQFGGLTSLGSDLPWRRRRFDRRLATGLFRPARRSVLTAPEVAGFLKPPTANCHPDNVLRSGALLGKAPALPEFDPEREDLIPLGRIGSERGERIVAVRTEESFFTYISGRSRYGKTETAIAQFVHLVRSGNGGLFLDPHGDALARIRPYLTAPEVARRVVEIDLGPTGAGAAQPGWNLFELGGADAAAREARVEAIVDAFASAMGWGERSTRAINLTTQTASALAAIAAVLPKEIAPTVFQIPTMLTDEAWRKAVLPFLPSASRAFWLDRFPRLSEEAVTPLTNVVDRLRGSIAATTLLGQSVGSYRAREAMDRGLIVLAEPGSGGTLSRLIANLIVFDLFHSAKGRGDLAAGERSPFFVCLDEIQTFDGGSSNLAELVEQTAKFGLRGIFLNQDPERLSPKTLAALLTNRSHLMTTALSNHAAALVTREWGGEPSPEEVGRLARHHFIAQATHRGELSRPFALGGVRVEDVLEGARPEAIGELRAISAEVTARRAGAGVRPSREPRRADPGGASQRA